MKNLPDSNLSSEKKTIDMSIKLLLILLLVAWSIMIIIPFLTPMLWGGILAITIFPLYTGLLKLVKGKKGLASTIITILLLAVLLVPSVFLISSVINEAKELRTALTDNTLVVPPPNPKVAEWPLIGQKLHDAWSDLSTNLEAAVVTYREQILQIGQKLLSSMKSVFSNILMFCLSIIISGIFLAYSEASKKSTSLFATRLFGSMSDEYTNAVVQTVRNVSKGILGVAFIQFVLMGICFVLAGVPFAGLWAILVFLLALIQLPAAFVAIPVVIYIYSVKEPFPATLWAVLILIAGLSDNVLKPLLMGKGAPVPMLVIFLGAIGGFILSGFIGLFTGSVVLSLCYKLFGLWVVDTGDQQTGTNVYEQEANI
jgi:predicted PurR-regulated permease PerM